MRTKNLRIGGVMRCCIETIEEYDDSESQPGDVVPCKYCSSSLILAEDDVWEWNRT